jgi:hypothetical protein
MGPPLQPTKRGAAPFRTWVKLYATLTARARNPDKRAGCDPHPGAMNLDDTLNARASKNDDITALTIGWSYRR